MRTVRCSGRLGGDVCLGGCLRGGMSARGASAKGGCLPGGVHLPHLLRTEFLTHACENITFPQLRLRTVINFLIPDNLIQEYTMPSGHFFMILLFFLYYEVNPNLTAHFFWIHKHQIKTYDWTTKP